MVENDSSGYDKLPGYKIHRLVRDVLNKEYNVNLYIEGSIKLNGFAQRLDFFDIEKMVFGQIIEKEKFINVRSQSAETAGTSEVGIMTTIFTDIENKIAFMQTSGKNVKRYFAVFSNRFTENNINYAKKWFDKKGTQVDIYTLEDIKKLGNKHDIDSKKYLDISNSENDKIPFHLDKVVIEDRLGREPVAKAFANLIQQDIFTESLNHSFMVHLNGEWGSGKSSFLKLIKKNLNKKKWIVIEYNAWQNQHINPPWWSFIDQVYQQSKKQFSWWHDIIRLRFLETYRRIIWYNSFYKYLSLLISAFLIFFILANWEALYNYIFNLPSTSENFDLIDFIGLITGVSAIVGLIYSISKFMSTSFLLNSSNDATSFVLKAKDPMNRIKKHFESLIDNINDAGYEVTIFVDDIDRCNKDFIVNLLEGIQTLFKEKRVLYIIAGDKNWITKSFGKTYVDFALEEVSDKQLGDLFLEKVFQLSLRMPNLSEEAKRNYWNYILGVQVSSKDKKINSIEELSEEQRKEIEKRLSTSKSELTTPKFMKEMEEDFNLSGDTISNIVISEKNKDSEVLRHLFQDYHRYIDTNPRAIIRLANNYTMIRSTLIAERAVFNEQKLFRWLAIEGLCPQIKEVIPVTQEINELVEKINKIKTPHIRDNCLLLLKDNNSLLGGAIEISEIKIFKGL